MSVQKILQESIEKNPLGLKEAFVEELRFRLGLALEAKMYGEEIEEIDESWSDGISSRTAHVHARKAREYNGKAKDSARIAKMYEKGSPEHNKHMGDYHSAAAKAIKSSYHAGQWGDMTTAKKDYKEEMTKAKEYRSTNESFNLSDYTLEELEDFMVSEEFDQLDEISKKTVVSYLTKAADSQNDAKGKQSFPGAALGVKKLKDPKTYDKRASGISHGVSKILGTAKIKATESFDLDESEQIDEISTPKLARYMKSAATDMANKSADREYMKSNMPDKTDDDERTKEKVDNTFKKMIGKRKSGIAQAASKIARKHSED
jgi:hypothetical protein